VVVGNEGLLGRAFLRSGHGVRRLATRTTLIAALGPAWTVIASVFVPDATGAASPQPALSSPAAQQALPAGPPPTPLAFQGPSNVIYLPAVATAGSEDAEPPAPDGGEPPSEAGAAIAPTTVSSLAPPTGGRFGYPLREWTGITDRFGVDRGNGIYHGGLDLALDTAVHSPVYAACTGRVVAAASNSGYGNFVFIDCGQGFATLYAHLSRIDVREGQAVEAASPLGLSGSTGYSTGEHLHFETWQDGARVDPEIFLNFDTPGAPPTVEPGGLAIPGRARDLAASGSPAPAAPAPPREAGHRAPEPTAAAGPGSEASPAAAAEGRAPATPDAPATPAERATSPAAPETTPTPRPSPTPTPGPTRTPSPAAVIQPPATQAPAPTPASTAPAIQPPAASPSPTAAASPSPTPTASSPAGAASPAP
jgi:murein DD-endopeptidase MepM/ murein hydrolase activator NlpD